MQLCVIRLVGFALAKVVKVKLIFRYSLLFVVIRRYFLIYFNKYVFINLLIVNLFNLSIFEPF